MGKKKAKEPETPAKDEVSNFAEKSTENLPIESFLTMKLTFWSCGKPSRSFDDLFIHDKKTHSTIEIVLSIIFLIYFRVAERLSKIVLFRNSQVVSWEQRDKRRAKKNNERGKKRMIFMIL